jgi:hypothetical protein
MIYSETFSSAVELTGFLNRKGIDKSCIVQITEVKSGYSTRYTLFYTRGWL